MNKTSDILPPEKDQHLKQSEIKQLRNWIPGKSMETTAIIKYLKKLPLFDGLPQAIIVDMAEGVTTQKLVKDEILFRRGDPGNSLFVIRTGWVKITTEDGDGDELVLNHCGPSEVIGEMALIDEEPRSASVVALSPVELLELRRETFMDALYKQPLLAVDVMRNLSARIRYATTYIEKAIEWPPDLRSSSSSFRTM